MHKVKPKLRAQFEYCDKEQIPFAVIVGPDEWKDGFVKVKEQRGKEESTGDGEKVPLDKLVAWIKERL
jgi:histidyl-tRNA synthetase